MDQIKNFCQSFYPKNGTAQETGNFAVEHAKNHFATNEELNKLKNLF